MCSRGKGVPSWPTMPTGVPLTSPSAPSAAASAVSWTSTAISGAASRRSAASARALASSRSASLGAERHEPEGHRAPDAARADHADDPGRGVAAHAAVAPTKPERSVLKPSGPSSPNTTVFTAPRAATAGSRVRTMRAARSL